MTIGIRHRTPLVLVVLASVVVGLAVSRQGFQMETTAEAPAGPTIFLSDLQWEWATTGWVALADDHLPKLDSSFLNGPITIGEECYDKGIGTFPLSEIVYSLDGRYSLFQAEVGVDASVPEGRGSVVFKLFLDDVLVYDSGVLMSGMAAREVEISVAGVSRMRLVVEDSGDGSSMDYADWGNARLTLAAQESAQGSNPLLKMLEAARAERQVGRDLERATVMQQSAEEVEALNRAFQGGPNSEDLATAAFDADRQMIVLANDKLGLALGYGGDRHGRLSVVDLETRRVVAYDTAPSLVTDDGRTTILPQNTVAREGGYRFRPVEDPVLGAGMEVIADYDVPDAGQVVSAKLTLFDGASHFTYQLELRESEPTIAVRRFSYFDPEAGGYLLVGDDALYLTDYSLIRRGEVRDDSILRRELVGLGKPLLLYCRSLSRGILMSIIDQVPDPAHFSLRLETGHVAGSLGFAHPVPDDVRVTRVQTSPRLFFQVTPGGGVQRATSLYREVMAKLYPQPPLPGWVKYQWGTWYAFNMGYDEEILKGQIDYIAENLADLGPWSVLLDAGWYVAEGRPDSSWVADEEKFPNGLRALVDYAHARGVKVILYFSAPYLDDRAREGNWLGLRGFIEEHPDWLIPLEAGSEGASYVYDFTNPDLVEYVRKLISDFFILHDVDGIKIDGLGQAEGEQLTVEERDSFGDVNKIRMFTMDIYRLIYEEAVASGKEVYIESGWAIPNFATQYAHTFRYGDEFPSFENRYPAGGLLEHIDYATLQKGALGQRPNMGMVWGGPESQRAIRQWFEAALAMGAQMTLSTDLTRMSPRDLSALRAVLVHYNAFQGETRFVGIPFAQSFATTSNGTTYLGALNRGREPRSVTLRLADHGLDAQREYLMYDVSSGRHTKVRGSFSIQMEGSSFRLFLLRDTPGMIWTNSSFTTESGPQSLRIRVSGPGSLMGFAQILVPPPSKVLLDGVELSSSADLKPSDRYWYDGDTGVLRLRYDHRRQHLIEVEY